MPPLEYLDHNVIVALFKNERPGLREHIDARKGVGYVYPYSPAHIEEVAVIFRDQKVPEEADRLVAEHLQLIEGVSDGWELLPEGANPTRLVQESPRVCMGRVLVDYDLTLAAEENERSLMSRKSAKAFDAVQEEFGADLRAGPGVGLFEERRAAYGADAKKVSGLDEEAVFRDSHVLEGLRQKLWNYGWNLEAMPKGGDLLRSHKDRELVVNLVLSLLEEVGYRADKFEKYRSRMHDVTHAIYAAAADIFVSGDERYRKRVRATYHFLGFKTRVLSIEEFIALNAG